MPIVREISVHGNYKAWGNTGDNGKAGGTEVVYTVVPSDAENPGWNLQQAGAIALQLRYEIQKIILADMQIRKLAIPPDAMQILHEYETKITKLKEMVSGDLTWKEKQEQAPLGGSNATSPSE